MKPFSNLETFNKPFRLKLLWWVVGGLTGSWTINSLQCFGQILGTHFNSYRPAPHDFSRTLGDRLANVFCELAEWRHWSGWKKRKKMGGAFFRRECLDASLKLATLGVWKGTETLIDSIFSKAISCSNQTALPKGAKKGQMDRFYTKPGGIHWNSMEHTVEQEDLWEVESGFFLKDKHVVVIFAVSASNKLTSTELEMLWNQHPPVMWFWWSSPWWTENPCLTGLQI